MKVKIENYYKAHTQQFLIQLIVEFDECNDTLTVTTDDIERIRSFATLYSNQMCTSNEFINKFNKAYEYYMETQSRKG